jgi:hypothetical protein
MRASTIVALAGAVIATTARAESSEPLAIRVLVVNRATAPSDILKSAQAESSRIYSTIGVAIDWITVEPDHGAYTEHAHDLKVNIVRDSRAKERRLILGVAERSEDNQFQVVYAFYRRIENLAQLVSTDIAVILGHVLAHELAHLLLPHNSHTSSGVMSANWDRGGLNDMSKGVPAFTVEQADRIRTRVRNMTTNR